jgi:CDP-glucose 4,6-dehydratase
MLRPGRVGKSMAMQQLQGWLDGKRVLVTGHTGFKGSWLTLWLASLGADVTGVSLLPDQGEDNLFDRAEISKFCNGYILDIRDSASVARVFTDNKPEVVFHLAAQALVNTSYALPIETFSTNVMGTANILEAARKSPSVKSLVCVTTDKVYKNAEKNLAFDENDELGGADPYSASKSAAEMVAASYMQTLVPPDGTMQLATARGGNVIGGGDWSQNRLIPDLVRAWHRGEPLVLRNPRATRPWQHVLELCFGYIFLAYRLDLGDITQKKSRSYYRGAWNFGPEASNEIAVSDLVSGMTKALGQPSYPVVIQPSALHESHYLRLNSTKSKSELGWRPLLTMDETIEWTLHWYQKYLENFEIAQTLMSDQISNYQRLITSSIRI